jgi:hypothetical protein
MAAAGDGVGNIAYRGRWKISGGADISFGRPVQAEDSCSKAQHQHKNIGCTTEAEIQWQRPVTEWAEVRRGS